jgi:hypothetical protein
MAEGAQQTEQTRPYQLYTFCRDRVAQEGMAIHREMKWLFTVEASALAFAAGLTVVAWIALTRQAETDAYTTNYPIILMKNATACVIWLIIQGMLCYAAGWELTRNAEAKVKSALNAWHSLLQESERVKDLWETKHRPAEEGFQFPSFATATTANGSLITQTESQPLDFFFRLIRLMWLSLFVSGLILWCVQIWIAWCAIDRPPGIRV